MSCRVTGCQRRVAVKSRRLCMMHYRRLRRNGEVGPAASYHSWDRTGSNNPNWRGGRIRGGEAMRYWRIHMPSHPAADNLGYVLEHRLLMERHLGRRLRPDEIVHHVNHDASDNRIENLAVMTQSEHIREHKPRLGTGRTVA